MTKAQIEREVKISLENCYMLGGSRGTPDRDTAYIDRLTRSIMTHIDNLEPKVEADSKYPDGYRPKIEYWNGELRKAIDDGDLKNIERCYSKLNYFQTKQHNKI